MEQELFKRLLSQVADWHIPPMEGWKSKQEVNFTYAPEIVQVKFAETQCQDCNQMCAQGRQLDIKQYVFQKRVFWRRRCVTCKMTQNPWTGAYDLTLYTANHQWNRYIRDNK